MEIYCKSEILTTFWNNEMPYNTLSVGEKWVEFNYGTGAAEIGWGAGWGVGYKWHVHPVLFKTSKLSQFINKEWPFWQKYPCPIFVIQKCTFDGISNENWENLTYLNVDTANSIAFWRDGSFTQGLSLQPFSANICLLGLPWRKNKYIYF